MEAIAGRGDRFCCYHVSSKWLLRGLLFYSTFALFSFIANSHQLAPVRFVAFLNSKRNRIARSYIEKDSPVND